MNEGGRIGILGGTLDPIHVGHIDAALAAKEALRLERILVIPANVPPHRATPATSPFHRFAMAALAISGLQGFVVSDMELTAPGPSYTADTLVRLREMYGAGPWQFFFITGADAFAEIETWSRYPAVLDLANFVVVSRPGTPAATMRTRLPQLRARMRLPVGSFVTGANTGAQERHTAIFLVDAPTADVSATEIRRRAAGRLPLAGLVPAGVEHHIQQHGLYVSPPLTSSAADHLHGQN